jgi:hypothetical protein
VNAIMPFSILALLWLGLTVAAFIAGAIARHFPGKLGKESRTTLGHRYTAPGGSWFVRPTVRVPQT